LIHFTSETFVKLDENGEEEDGAGLIPCMVDSINELDFLVTWKKVSNGAGGEEDVPYPRPGLDETFDKANEVEE